MLHLHLARPDLKSIKRQVNEVLTQLINTSHIVVKVTGGTKDFELRYSNGLITVKDYLPACDVKTFTNWFTEQLKRRRKRRTNATRALEKIGEEIGLNLPETLTLSKNDPEPPAIHRGAYCSYLKEFIFLNKYTTDLSVLCRVLSIRYPKFTPKQMRNRIIKFCKNPRHQYNYLLIPGKNAAIPKEIVWKNW